MRGDPEKVEAEAQARSYNRHARRGADATGRHPQEFLDEGDGPQVDSGDRFLPAAQVWRRYGVSSMSLHRWIRDPTMNFPPATYIGRRRYWRLSDLVRWERARAGRGAK